MDEARLTTTGRVTASTVVAAAGVSRATVSYGMNLLNRYNVAEKSGVKVLRAAAEPGNAPVDLGASA